MILLHYFVDAKDAKAAKAAATALDRAVRALVPKCRVKGLAPKPYWKIEGCYESCVEVTPPNGESNGAIQRTLAKHLASGWRWFPSKTCAVWRKAGRKRFKVAEVRWAELDLGK